MYYSLQAVFNLVGLIRGTDNKTYLPNVYFWCDYPFLDAAAYFVAVREYLLNKSYPRDELKEHLKAARFIVEVMNGMERETMAAKVQCLYRCLAASMYEVYWDRMYYKMVAPMEWECKESVSVVEAMDYWSLSDENCRYYEFTGKELFERVGKILEELEFLSGLEEKDNAQHAKAAITIPESILKKLAEEKCYNGKPFIEDANAFPLKWLQNKQLARELLTHDKIKGSLSVTEIERRTPNTFIDNNDKPLKLAKPKKKDEDPNHKRLMRIFTTL